MRRFAFRTIHAVVVALAMVAPARAFEPNGMVVFMTDFGVRDDAVAICKGVMLARDATLRIIDLTHDVTPYDIREGAFYLAQAASAFPKGTVFVGVVDPGVGTSRRAVAVETRAGQLFVLPDNGLVTFALDASAAAGSWEITNRALMAESPTPTFHGRDVFSPAAAAFASGRSKPSDAGPAVEKLVLLAHTPAAFENGRWHAEVLLLDKAYGNVWTNLTREDLAKGRAMPTRLRVEVAGKTLDVPFVRTFGDVPEGAMLAYLNSRDLLSLAINMGNLAETEGIRPGMPIVVTPAP